MLEVLSADCLFLSQRNAFYDTINELCLTFTFNDCNPQVPVWFISFNFFMCGKQLVMSVKTFQVGRDNPSND